MAGAAALGAAGAADATAEEAALAVEEAAFVAFFVRFLAELVNDEKMPARPDAGAAEFVALISTLWQK